MSIVLSQNPYFRPVDQIDFRSLPETTVKELKSKKNWVIINDCDSFNFILELMKGNYYLSRQKKRVEFQGCVISREQMRALTEMTNISEIVFINCTFPHRGIYQLSAMNLATLGIFHAQLNQKVNELVSLKIRTLSLIDCRLKDEDMEVLAKGKLEEVQLGTEDKITPQGVLALASSKTITGLHLLGVMKEWTSDEKMKVGRALAQNSRLVKLDISGNNMNFAVAFEVAHSQSLEYLNFSENKGDYQNRLMTFEAFANNRVLRSLRVEECEICDKDVVALSRNQSLTCLAIGCNKFSDVGVKALASHPAITDLSLLGNHLGDGVGFNRFIQLQSLNIAFLNHRGFNTDKAIISKKIAQEVATLPNLTTLAISAEGDAVEAFFKTKTLTTFSLFHDREKYDYDSAIKIMNARTTRVRQVVHNWQRVCFMLAFYRANGANPIRDSALSLTEEVMSFHSI